MKIKYNNIQFDSELEVEYYKYLISDQLKFTYHPKSITLANGSMYTPDFIIEYDDRVEIIETKGYNQFSALRDKLVDDLMRAKSEQELREYLDSINISSNNKKIEYHKIKYLKKYGWVDFKFKNPNNLSKKRKEKIDKLTKENKNLARTAQEYARIKSYLNKIDNQEKLNKNQLQYLQTKLGISKKIIDKIVG